MTPSDGRTRCKLANGVSANSVGITSGTTVSCQVYDTLRRALDGADTSVKITVIDVVVFTAITDRGQTVMFFIIVLLPQKEALNTHGRLRWRLIVDTEMQLHVYISDDELMGSVDLDTSNTMR